MICLQDLDIGKQVNRQMKGLTQQFSKQFMCFFSRENAWKDLEAGFATDEP